MQEIELKLTLPSAQLSAIQDSLPQMLGEPLATQTLDSRYFDTPDLALRDAKISLRMRRQGEHFIQTLKGKGNVQGGLHQRLELNWEVAKPELDLGLLAESDLEIPAALDTLQPAFQTLIERKTWDVRLDNSRIEVALDIGQVIAGDLSRPVCELEMELREGEASAIWALAERVVEKVPAWLGYMSKAQLGYALTGLDSQKAIQRPKDPNEALAMLSQACDKFEAGDWGSWPEYLLALSALRQQLPESLANIDDEIRAQQVALVRRLQEGGEPALAEWFRASTWVAVTSLQLVRALQAELGESS